MAPQSGSTLHPVQDLGLEGRGRRRGARPPPRARDARQGRHHAAGPRAQGRRSRVHPPRPARGRGPEPRLRDRGDRPGGNRPGRGVARRPRPRAGPRVRGPVPPAAVRPVQGRVDRDGDRSRRGPGARAPPAGGDRASGVHRAGEGGHRGAVPAEAPVRCRRGGGGRVPGAGAAVSRRRRTGRRPGHADGGVRARGVVTGGAGGAVGRARRRGRGVVDGRVRGRRPLRARRGPRGDPRAHGRGGRDGAQREARPGLPAGAGAPAAGGGSARGRHAGRRAGRAGRGRRRPAAAGRAGRHRARAPPPGRAVGVRRREDQRLDRVAGSAAVEPAFDGAGRPRPRPDGARCRARGPRPRQGVPPRVPGRAAADPVRRRRRAVFHRAARDGQDLAGQVHGRGPRARLREARLRRAPRRYRPARPQPNVAGRPARFRTA